MERRGLSRKWFTLAQTPRDREMTLEVLYDLEKWSPWKLAPPFGLINIRFYVPHLTYLHVPGISADNHNGNIGCERKEVRLDGIKTHKNLFLKNMSKYLMSAIIGLHLHLKL